MTTDMAESIIRASELEYRKDTSYQDIDLSNKEVASGMMQQGMISLYDLARLITEFPNDQELGFALRKLLNKI